MAAIDLKRVLKDLYNPPANKVTYVDVPEMNFLMIDGAGDPNSAPEYQAAIEALYAVAYGLKFMLKRGAQALDYVVMPSEGLWWADDMNEFSMEKKGDWRWTMMIAQPPEVTADMVSRGHCRSRQEEKPPGAARHALRRLSRRSFGADHAHRPLCRRGTHRRSATRIHPRQWLRPHGQTPRDLPERSSQDRAREDEDHPQAAHRPRLREGRSITSRRHRIDTAPTPVSTSICARFCAVP